MNPTPQPPVRRKSNARAVWITLSAVVGALVVFFIGVAAGAAGPDTSNTAATKQPTVTVRATTTATVTTTVTATESVTATVTRTSRASTSAKRHVTQTSRPTTTRHHHKPVVPTRTRTSAPAQHGVHPGAFCTPHGGIGYTDKGTRMRCTTKSGDVGPNGPYWRWRAAG